MNSAAVEAILLHFFLSGITKRKDCESTLTFRNSNNFFNSLHDGQIIENGEKIFSDIMPSVLKDKVGIGRIPAKRLLKAVGGIAAAVFFKKCTAVSAVQNTDRKADAETSANIRTGYGPGLGKRTIAVRFHKKLYQRSYEAVKAKHQHNK